MERPRFVTFRATAAEIDRVDALARATMRNRSDLLRLLVAQARLADTPDVVLDTQASVEGTSRQRERDHA